VAAPRPPYLFFRYFAHELRFSSCSLTSCLLELLGDSWSLSMCVDLDLASSPPNLEVKGVRISSASSSSSSSFPPSPIMAELLLLANFAFLSLSAAYLDLPLGYCNSPDIFLVAATESSGVALF